MQKLSDKQQKFVDAYVGNATEAALQAGYSKNTARQIGQENLTKPVIIAAIKARQEKPRINRIATREERQSFWTNVMHGKEKDITYEKGQKKEIDVKMSDRLKAAELLGRSEADFTDNIKTPGGINIYINKFADQEKESSDG